MYPSVEDAVITFDKSGRHGRYTGAELPLWESPRILEARVQNAPCERLHVTQNYHYHLFHTPSNPISNAFWVSASREGICACTGL